MKQVLNLSVVLLFFTFANCNATNTKSDSQNKSTTSNSATVKLTNDGFKQKVFNYEVNKDWKYQGNLPAIIDFYADWCGPCKKLSPILEEIAKEYKGKIIVYKVDTDVEKVLAGSLGIQSLPTLLFIPAKGKPQATMGLVPKETLVKAINEVLLIK